MPPEAGRVMHTGHPSPHLSNLRFSVLANRIARRHIAPTRLTHARKLWMGRSRLNGRAGPDHSQVATDRVLFGLVGDIAGSEGDDR